MSINRYIATDEKNAYYQTTRYPKFPRQATDLYIISRDLDRLDLLSNEFYEDPRYWWVISQANPELEKGTLLVPPGIQLRIPFPLEEVTEKLEQVEANK